MTRYLLDTNIVSEAGKRIPSAPIARWLERQTASDLFIAALTIAEIWRGILELPSGRRRRALEEWFTGPEGPQAAFQNRILPFDDTAALEWGRLMSEGRAMGRSRSPIDMIIAATAAVRGCVIVTTNVRHFQGIVELLNPLSAEA